MLSQWLWNILCYAEQVLLKHCVLCWASDCESSCVMQSKWLWNIVCNAEPVTVNHRLLFWASDYESWCVMRSKLLWITVMYAEPVTVNQCALFLASGCKSWKFCQWSWTMVMCTDSVAVNHVVFCWAVVFNDGEICWASGCDSLWTMLIQWLRITVCYAEPVVVKHCELCCGQCLWITVCNVVPLVVNYCEFCWASVCETLWVMLSQWLRTIVSYPEPVVVK